MIGKCVAAIIVAVDGVAVDGVVVAAIIVAVDGVAVAAIIVAVAAIFVSFYGIAAIIIAIDSVAVNDVESVVSDSHEWWWVFVPTIVGKFSKMKRKSFLLFGS